MKVKKLLALIVCAVALIVSACATQTNFDGQIKVTFCLEGGVYQNSKRDVVVYYPASEEKRCGLLSGKYVGTGLENQKNIRGLLL